MVTRIKPRRMNTSNTGTSGNDLAYQSESIFDRGVGGGNMKYADFYFETKSGSSIEVGLSTQITPTENFVVTPPSNIKDGQIYILRVDNDATTYNMSLTGGITNPHNIDLTLTAYATDMFVFLAVDGTLELQPESGRLIVDADDVSYDNTTSGLTATDVQSAIDEISQIPSITVDSALDSTSTNPVENGVITNALNDKQDILTAGNNITISGTTISATDTTYSEGEGISITNVVERDTKGPAPSGYHIPTSTEWTAVRSILVTTFGLPAKYSTAIYLKIPLAGYRGYPSGNNIAQSGIWGRYFCSTNDKYIAIYNSGSTSSFSINNIIMGNHGCYSLRCFKNTPVTPDNTWTTLYDGSTIASGAGVFWDSTNGLISISGDGTTWYTIQDKNLGATTVYEDGDTLSESNCGYYYQWGNNYGFAGIGTTASYTISTTQVDTTGYGPGNYYESDIYINPSGDIDWYNPVNDNLRGGTSQGTYTTESKQINNTGVISLGGSTGTITLGSNLSISNNTLSATDTTYSAGTGINISNNTISVDADASEITYDNTTSGLSATDVQDAIDEVNSSIPEVINNLTSTSTTNALSAYQGNVLKGLIDDMTGLGRFLSLRDCSTGLPISFPLTTPYTYNTGDYFIVETIDGTTDYRPTGSSYSGTASTTQETDEVEVGDVYVYDGSVWLLQSNHGKTVSFANIAGQPTDNTNLATALAAKQDVLTAGSNITISNNTISATDTTYTAGTNIAILNGNDYSAMQGPAPSGYHVPLSSEWSSLCSVLTGTFGLASTGATMQTYLKMPFAGYRNYNSAAGVYEQGYVALYWSADAYSIDDAYCLCFDSTGLYPLNWNYRAYGYSLRLFKDEPVTPDNTWTTLYDGSSVATNAGVFWNSTNGLISISGDGTTWYTITDKNLGATTVYNSGDTLSESNCGYYYQWGNNYGFAGIGGSVTTSSTQVDASGYGPGNYYSSSIFIEGEGNNDWSSVQNDNLWGGETGITTLTNAITTYTNTKAFTLSGASDLTTAQSIAEWIDDGNMAIILYNNDAYIFHEKQTSPIITYSFFSVRNYEDTGYECKKYIELQCTSGTTVNYVYIDTYNEYQIPAGDMAYSDFGLNALSGTTITISSLVNTLSTSADITVSAGTSLKAGQRYTLRVTNTDSGNDHTMTFDSVAYLIPDGATVTFRFLALSSSSLYFQGPRLVSALPASPEEGEIYYVV